MSGGYAGKSIPPQPIRSFTRSAAWDFASVLLTKHDSLLDPAIRADLHRPCLAPGRSALFGYVYWSSALYSARAAPIGETAAEYATLRQAYDTRRRSELVAASPKRWPGAAAEGGRGIYLLADASFAPIAGNLKAWPRLARDGEGFAAPAGRPGELRHIRARSKSFRTAITS